MITLLKDRHVRNTRVYVRRSPAAHDRPTAAAHQSTTCSSDPVDVVANATAAIKPICPQPARKLLNERICQTSSTTHPEEPTEARRSTETRSSPTRGMKPNERSRHHSRVAWISSSARLESVAFVEHTVEAVDVSAWLDVMDGVDEGLTRSLCVVVSIDTRRSGGVYAHRNDSMKSIMLLAGVAECRGDGSIQSRHGEKNQNSQRPENLYTFSVPRHGSGCSHGAAAWTGVQKYDTPWIRILTHPRQSLIPSVAPPQRPLIHVLADIFRVSGSQDGRRAVNSYIAKCWA